MVQNVRDSVSKVELSQTIEPPDHQEDVEDPASEHPVEIYVVEDTIVVVGQPAKRSASVQKCQAIRKNLLQECNLRRRRGIRRARFKRIKQWKMSNPLTIQARQIFWMTCPQLIQK